MSASWTPIVQPPTSSAQRQRLSLLANGAAPKLQYDPAVGQPNADVRFMHADAARAVGERIDDLEKG